MNKEFFEAVKALEKGIHCLCEKPMALSPAECARMADAATRSGRSSESLRACGTRATIWADIRGRPGFDVVDPSG